MVFRLSNHRWWCSFISRTVAQKSSMKKVGATDDVNAQFIHAKGDLAVL